MAKVEIVVRVKRVSLFCQMANYLSKCIVALGTYLLAIDLKWQLKVSLHVRQKLSDFAVGCDLKVQIYHKTMQLIQRERKVYLTSSLVVLMAIF